MKIENIQLDGYGCLQLIIDEKTALIDSGHYFSAEDLCSKVKALLADQPLDFVFLTHSHFDHVGGLSQLRKAYPDLKVVASAKSASVFQRDGARSFIKKMASDTWTLNLKTEMNSYDDSGLYVDEVVKEGDVIDLGGSHFSVIESKGHTDCCISFYCKEESILFASESSGVWFGKFPLDIELCKSYFDAINSIDRQRALFAKTLYLPHAGKLEFCTPEEYFSLAKAYTVQYKDLVLTAVQQGLNDEQICVLCKKNMYDVMVENGIDFDSIDRWLINLKAFINVIRKEFQLAVDS